MNRRKAIRNIGWGLSGGYVLPSLLSACAKDDPGPDIPFSGNVAIIGGGAAGLYAADILNTKGIKVTIYEAREQLGGRIRSQRNQLSKLPAEVTGTPPDIYPLIPWMNSDFPLEFGAQTLIGTDSIFAKMFKALGLPTLEFDPTGNYYVMDNVAKTEADWGGDPAFASAKSFMAGLSTHGGSTQSVQDEIVAAGVDAKAYNILNSQIGNVWGTNNARLGMGNTSEEVALRSTDGKIVGLSANPMQDALVSRFSAVQPLAKLNTPIVSINYGADPIKLTAKDNTVYEANIVIVTVPISVLKSGGLSFSPSLPATVSGSLSKFSMGSAIRVILEFKKNFWGETGPFILGSANVPEYFSQGLGHSQFNSTLSVTAFGEKAEHLSGLADEAMLDEILADLDAVYPDPVAAYPGLGTKYISKVLDLRADYPDIQVGQRIYLKDDWTNREYIKGGIAFPLPGATHQDRINIGAPVNNKIFFAGEATDVSGQAGTVNGAMASAERVTQEVIQAIKGA